MTVFAFGAILALGTYGRLRSINYATQFFFFFGKRVAHNKIYKEAADIKVAICAF